MELDRLYDCPVIALSLWVAPRMRAGGAYAHSMLMLATMAKQEEKRKDRLAH
jgi:hypothetical protein